MINYLISNFQEISGKVQKCIKVGKSEKSFDKSRLSAYLTHNGPGGYKLLGTKESETGMFERFIHIKYSNIALPNPLTGRNTEWCLWSQDLIDDFFSETEESLGRWVWDNILRDQYHYNSGEITGMELTAAEYLSNKYYIKTAPLKTLLRFFIDSKGERLPANEPKLAEYFKKIGYQNVTPNMTLRQIEVKYESLCAASDILNNANKLNEENNAKNKD